MHPSVTTLRIFVTAWMVNGSIDEMQRCGNRNSRFKDWKRLIAMAKPRTTASIKSVVFRQTKRPISDAATPQSRITYVTTVPYLEQCAIIFSLHTLWRRAACLVLSIQLHVGGILCPWSLLSLESLPVVSRFGEIFAALHSFARSQSADTTGKPSLVHASLPNKTIT